MLGLWAPFLLICVAIIPLVPFFVWFKARNFGSLRFLLSLGAGILAIIPAALVQRFFPPPNPRFGIGPELFGAFIRISLVEETCRFLTLSLLFHFCPYSRIAAPHISFPNGENKKVSFFGGPSGLVAGLGFAAGESVFYGLTDPGVVILRAFTAAPLHAACGARIGTALGVLTEAPLRAGFLILAAIFIHGIYNFFILNPGIPWFLPVFIALTALASSILAIWHEGSAAGLLKGEKNGNKKPLV